MGASFAKDGNMEFSPGSISERGEHGGATVGAFLDTSTAAEEPPTWNHNVRVNMLTTKLSAAAHGITITPSDDVVIAYEQRFDTYTTRCQGSVGVYGVVGVPGAASTHIAAVPLKGLRVSDVAVPVATMSRVGVPYPPAVCTSPDGVIFVAYAADPTAGTEDGRVDHGGVRQFILSEMRGRDTIVTSRAMPTHVTCMAASRGHVYVGFRGVVTLVCYARDVDTPPIIFPEDGSLEAPPLGVTCVHEDRVAVVRSGVAGVTIHATPDGRLLGRIGVVVAPNPCCIASTPLGQLVVWSNVFKNAHTRKTISSCIVTIDSDTGRCLGAIPTGNTSDVIAVACTATTCFILRNVRLSTKELSAIGDPGNTQRVVAHVQTFPLVFV